MYSIPISWYEVCYQTNRTALIKTLLCINNLSILYVQFWLIGGHGTRGHHQRKLTKEKKYGGKMGNLHTYPSLSERFLLAVTMGGLFLLVQCQLICSNKLIPGAEQNHSKWELVARAPKIYVGDVVAQLAKATGWARLQRSSSGLDPGVPHTVSWGAAGTMNVYHKSNFRMWGVPSWVKTIDKIKREKKICTEPEPDRKEIT
jgi:hypothetical protein